MNSEFEGRALEMIREYKMLSVGDTVIAGFSGGSDSTALMSLLIALKEEYSLELIAAHVNHGLRPGEAERDESFVVDFCREKGLKLELLHARVEELSRERGLSEEACGREVRYDFYLSLARKEAAEKKLDFRRIKIATAHNARDSAETLLFNLARGAGLHGLCGIAPLRELGGFTVIRPVLFADREEILAYLEEKGLSFVTDSTNFDTLYSRNRIRHNILPELEKINGAAVRNIASCALRLRDDDAFLEAEAEKILSEAKTKGGYNTKALLPASDSLRMRALFLILGREAPGQDSFHLQSLDRLLLSGGRLQLKGGYFASVSDGLLSFSKKAPQPESAQALTEEIRIGTEKGSRVFEFAGRKVTLIFKDREELLSVPDDGFEILDADALGDEIIARNRRPGDKIFSGKRALSKTLKNLFNEKKIPPSMRASLLILERDGEIFFLEGFGPAGGYEAKEESKKLLLVKISEKGD